MSFISIENMQRYMSELDTAIKNFVLSKLDDKQNAPTLLQQNLLAGDTTITFTGIPTEGLNKITTYTSVNGLNYESLDDSIEGEITLTYAPQNVMVTVYVMIEVIE